MTPEERVFVHLAYMDDSGTRDKKSAFQIIAAVLIEDTVFNLVEVMTTAMAERILPEQRLPEFEEFKGWQLYRGEGIFDGIKQEARFDVIATLLRVIHDKQIPVVYGAVRKDKLVKTLYGSADPVDICFRICVKGISQVMRERFRKGLALLVLDDCDGDIKRTCKNSFRVLRQRMIVPSRNPDEFRRLHDDMYFGSSRDSVGIQLADLCACFIKEHLKGQDPAAESFYNMFADHIAYSKVEPEDDAKPESETPQ